jgi:hypothetical protein
MRKIKLEEMNTDKIELNTEEKNKKKKRHVQE